MKIKSKILMGLSSLALVACATSSESNSESSPVSNNVPVKASVSETKSAAVVAEPIRSTTPPSANENQALSDAIKSNNDEAVARAAQVVLSKNATDVRALNALGMYHYKKGHLKAAEYFYGRATRANPQIAEVHNNTGLVLLAQGEKNDAIKHFKKALEINSSEGNAAANLGALYLEEKDYKKAIFAMEIAYRKNSKDVKILNNYGVALAANQKLADARDMYKKAQSANPNDKDVLLNHAILLITQMSKFSEGQELIDKLKFLGPSAEARNVINVLENKAKAGLNK